MAEQPPPLTVSVNAQDAIVDPNDPAAVRVLEGAEAELALARQRALDLQPLPSNEVEATP